MTMGLAEVVATPGRRGAGEVLKSNSDAASRLGSDLTPNRRGALRTLNTLRAGAVQDCERRRVEPCRTVVAAREFVVGSDHRRPVAKGVRSAGPTVGLPFGETPAKRAWQWASGSSIASMPPSDRLPRSDPSAPSNTSSAFGTKELSWMSATSEMEMELQHGNHCAQGVAHPSALTPPPPHTSTESTPLGKRKVVRSGRYPQIP